MPENNIPNQRRKMIIWGSAIISGLAFISSPFVKKNKPVKIKMLTQDGRLVEIDGDRIPAQKKKITNSQLINWVKKS